MNIRIMALLSPLLLSACGSQNIRPIHTVEHVDLDRFMGDWFVIASIPTFIETEAHNAVETYAMNEDGTIATTFTFRDGGFDGELKRYNPTGYVTEDTGNAVWGMQFIWPIKAEYRVIYLDDNYQTTIIGRTKRDYVWLMSRQSELDESYYQELVSYIAEQGYDISELMKVPHRWDADTEKQQ